MGFSEQAAAFNSFDFDGYFDSVTRADIKKSLEKEDLNLYDFLNLLSESATDDLEYMAEKARELTIRHFGKTIGLYTPLYISDFCSNHCTYCGFNHSTRFTRTKLSMTQIQAEARAIADTGIRHVLVLTGEDPAETPLSYLEDAVSVLKKYFSSIALEIYPLDEDAYRVLKHAGADSLTVYQEVYDRAVYREVHPKGKKADYEYRLSTPERGARAGFRAINIGPLFGLGSPRTEAFMTGLHAQYLEREFPDVEISLSLPRMRKAPGGIDPKNTLTDIGFVQTLLAFRLFMPRHGITISTRESAGFRDRLIHLGATRFSAGSRTGVGGYALNGGASTVQFEITDDRTVAKICEMIRRSGYQPVFKDWERV